MYCPWRPRPPAPCGRPRLPSAPPPPQADILGDGTSQLLLAEDAKCGVRNARVVRVPGLSRGWTAAVASAAGVPVRPSGSAFNPSYTALGATYTEDDNDSCTGLVYEVRRRPHRAAALIQSVEAGPPRRSALPHHPAALPRPSSSPAALPRPGSPTARAQVGEEEYASELEREAAGGYLSVELPGDAFTVLGGPAIPADAKVALFSTPAANASAPSASLPISLAYIDIWLGGAFQLQAQHNLTAEGRPDLYGPSSGSP